MDKIRKDVVITDWHYDRPDKTAVYFAMKGLRVLTCPWKNPGYAVQQIKDMQNFRANSTPEMKDRFLGIMETTWSNPAQFIRGYYGEIPVNEISPANTYKTICDEFAKLN